MTERGRVRFRNTTIDFTVRRSARRRKSVQISVADGEVIVAAPVRTSARELEDIVRNRTPWILRQLSDEAQQPAPKRFVSGETLPYLGQGVTLTVALSHDPETTVRFTRGRFHVSAPADLDDEQRADAIRAAITAWYKDRAAQQLPELVERWLPSLGGDRPTRILIRNQKQRWGSCSADGTLRFNWRVMMLKPELIEYIVVHELSHLAHQNHSRDFWGHVSAAMPDAQQRRKALREAGRKLPTL